MALNPFEQVYDGIWTLIERNDAIREIVKLGNRIKFDEVVGPKLNQSLADKPELIVIPASGFANLKATSSTTKISKEYDILISTGDWDLSLYFNQLSWELLRALLGWDTILSAMDWENSSGFVKQLILMTIDEGAEQNQNRGLAGWSAIWTIRVDMDFLTSDLRVV